MVFGVTASGEADVHDERRSRGSSEVKGPEEASCLTLSLLIAPPEHPPPPGPQRGYIRRPFDRTLFTVEEGPAPVTVAFACHFAERKNASVVN